MKDTRLGMVEAKFADIIWNHEPLVAKKLISLCEEELNWKRTTTYTVLKRLCNKGLFRNDNGTISSVLSKEEFQATQSEQFVEETFNGSLPSFISAFASRKKLSTKEIAEIKKIIDQYNEE